MGELKALEFIDGLIDGNTNTGVPSSMQAWCNLPKLLGHMKLRMQKSPPLIKS